MAKTAIAPIRSLLRLAESLVVQSKNLPTVYSRDSCV